MNTLWKIALQNVLRNKRRTTITLISIVLGVLLICTLRGFINTIQSELVANITQSQTGDLQIFSKGYLKKMQYFPLDLTFSYDSVERGLSQLGIDRRQMSPRIRFAGLISVAGQSIPFGAIACDPSSEVAVCSKMPENIVKGRFLSDAGSAEIVINENMAKSLKVTLGGKAILLVVSKDGAQNTLEATVVGIMASNLRSDKFFIYANRADIQPLLMLPESAITELSVRLPSSMKNEAFKRKLDVFAKAQGSSLDIRGWEATMTFYRNVMTVQDGFNIIISVFLFILVATIIVNTMFMSVLERLREIGTMKAIGIPARIIKRLFMMEGLILGAAGGGVGILLSLLIMGIIHINGGLVYSIAVEFGAAKPWILHPFIPLWFVFVMLLYAMVCGLFASRFPAKWAAKQKPIDAINNKLVSRKA